MALRGFTKALLAFTALVQHAAAQNYQGPRDSRLQVALTIDTPSVGISTTPDGRAFLVYVRVDGSKGPLVVEVDRKTKKQTAFPNTEWNSYAPGKDPATHFVRINAQRVGPDGRLYVVDIGSPEPNAPVIIKGGPKIVQIDLKKNAVSRVYRLDNVTRSNSLINDIRFNLASKKAYITDAGSAGLIVLDLHTGEARRVVESDDSTKGVSPISAEGTLLRAYPSGKLQFTNVDQLEVSPDAKYLYYQPNNGNRLSRIPTKYLDQAFYNSSLSGEDGLFKYSEPFALTPCTGGSAIDSKGNIYVSDVDSQRIISIAANGTKTTLVQDPRLTWVDAMWVSGTKLYMPAAQLNRGNQYGNGKVNITKPLFIYTIDIGNGPSPVDHA